MQNIVIKHFRSPGFRVERASGAVVSETADAFELSFFCDRPLYGDEEMSECDMPGVYRPSGSVSATAIREHAVAISISLDNLKELYNTLGKIMAKKAAEGAA